MMETFRPTSGSSMSVSSSSMRCLSSVMEPFLRSRLSPLSSRSVSHQALFSASALASLSMSVSILLISLMITVKGFILATREATLATLSDFDTTAACLRNCTSSSRSEARFAVWSRICTKAAAPVAPSFVAPTLPKASKALSLFRIAMALEMAASSLAANILRFSKSDAFSLHISVSSARNSSSSSSCCFALPRELVLVPSVASLPDMVPCFLSKDSFSFLKVDCSVSMNFSWASTCAASAAWADSRLDLKVSFMDFRMPTMPPDWAE
mmetsp:Transcript_35020/g.104050  ORF Transcript_35020/g.104050 Transcript_35020/m.104050 type:complete len:268 (+) Transcript_35020:868-1671(+)